MTQPLPITPTQLRQMSICKRRVWLDHHGDGQQRDTFIPTAFIRGLQHEQTMHAATGDVMETIPVKSWSEGIDVTSRMMQDGVPTIIGAMLQHTESLATGHQITLRGRVDRLVRRVIGVRPAYHAIEIKQYTTLTAADVAQMDGYLHLLEKTQGRPVSGTFWLGQRADGLPQDEVHHDLDPDRMQTLLTNTIQTVQQMDAPPVHLASHCKTCPWVTACTEQAKTTLDLGLLPHLRQQTRDNLRRAGVSSLDQFAALSVTELQQIKGIKTTAPALKANAQAYVQQQPVWFNPLPESLQAGGWMLDLETAALAGGDGLPWSIGWGDHHGEMHVVVVAPYQDERILKLPDGNSVILVADKDAAWQTVANSVMVNNLPIYHWTGFDASIMQSTAPKAIRTALEPRMHDLHRTFINTVRLPQKSYSIKKVAVYFGFFWSGYQDWWRAETDYRDWLETGDEQSLAQACDYQRDDVLALVEIWSWLVNNRPKSVA
jgi:predicted RecB family nuclease